jgi:serine/threonine protein kinase
MENSIIDQRYQLIADIGSGGEARVFQARDESTGADVAVRMAQRLGGQMVGGAPAEYHEGWVRLLSAGSDPEYGDYQVFELLQGQTLRQTIENGTLAVDDWRVLVEQSLVAVEALHASGWVHGDLNADNLFLSSVGWRLLELPFHRYEAPQGRSAMFGSIHTLAPEQIDGKQPDARSDLYSLGCLYYYAAAGVYPHPGASAMDVAIHCLRFAPEPLREKVPGLPEAWADAVMQFIARKPEDRISDATAARQLLGVA